MIDWRHWHNEPYLVGGLIVLGWLYALGTGPFRSWIAPGATGPGRQALWFYSGLVVFYLAVGSPLDQAGERFLFSAHMVQHQLVIYAAPVLLLLGTPGWLVEPLLRLRGVRAVAAFFVHPLIAGGLYTLVISGWHVPALYDWALRDKLVHVVEHLTFFGVALLYWWPLLSPTALLPRLSPGGQMLFLTAMVITMTPLFAFLAFSTEVLYPTYEFAPRLFANFDAAQDQLLAAVIMKLGSLGLTLVVFALAFYRWQKADASGPLPRAARPHRPSLAAGR